MRHLRLRSSLGIMGFWLLAGGCRWTEFDELKEDTWVTSTGKPKNIAANWAVAVAGLGRGDSGGTLGVLGATDSLYSEVTIGPNGDVTIGNDVELDVEFTINSLALEPLFVPSPDGTEAALVTAVEASRSLAVRALGGQLSPVPVPGPGMPSGATYLLTTPRTGDPGPSTQILVAQGATVYPAYFNQASAPGMVSCELRDADGTMITIRALGAYRPSGVATDNVLVLTSTGKLIAYSGSVFHGCATPQPPEPSMSLDIGFMNAQSGSQLLRIEDGGASYALVQAHAEGNRGHLGLYRIGAGAIQAVGTARDLNRLKTAALFQPAGGAKRYVVAGFPTELVEGEDAGQVQVFEVDLASGVAPTPAMTLADARPEPNQAFGRGVAQLPFNGRSIIAVAADNDVFVYFRTTLYDETREGR